MISDVLAEALDEIDRYQRDFGRCYDGIRPEIDGVKAVMRRLLQVLDSPPGSCRAAPPTHGVRVYVPVFCPGDGSLSDVGHELTEDDLLHAGEALEGRLWHAAHLVGALRRGGWTARPDGRGVTCTHPAVRTKAEAGRNLVALGVGLDDVTIVAAGDP
jgi:hypothetical protein